MFDDMFAFIDPIVELNEEGTNFVIQAETFFEFLEKAGIVIPRGADGRRSTRVSDGICYTGKKKKDSQESGNIEGLPEQDSGVKNAGHPGSPSLCPKRHGKRCITRFTSIISATSTSSACWRRGRRF